MIWSFLNDKDPQALKQQSMWTIDRQRIPCLLQQNVDAPMPHHGTIKQEQVKNQVRECIFWTMLTKKLFFTCIYIPQNVRSYKKNNYPNAEKWKSERRKKWKNKYSFSVSVCVISLQPADDFGTFPIGTQKKITSQEYL